jgi:hypothetical protein
METTWQPSLSTLQSKLTILEALELAFLTFGIWFLGALVDLSDQSVNVIELFTLLLTFEIVVLGSWILYNIYIRIARAGGRTVDIGLWIIASALTASYTFWAWTILDINRFIVAKLLYRGVAPVEYAWSIQSKQARKFWEQARKDGEL